MALDRCLVQPDYYEFLNGIEKRSMYQKLGRPEEITPEEQAKKNSSRMVSGLDVSKMNAKKTVLFMRKYQEVSGKVLKTLHLANRRLLNQVTSSTNLQKQNLINRIYDRHIHGPKSTSRDRKVSDGFSPDTLEVPGSRKSEASETSKLKNYKPVSIKIHSGNFSGIDHSGTWGETGPGTSLCAKHPKSNFLRDPGSTTGPSPVSAVSRKVRGG